MGDLDDFVRARITSTLEQNERLAGIAFVHGLARVDAERAGEPDYRPAFVAATDRRLIFLAASLTWGGAPKPIDGTPVEWRFSQLERVEEEDVRTLAALQGEQRWFLLRPRAGLGPDGTPWRVIVKPDAPGIADQRAFFDGHFRGLADAVARGEFRAHAADAPRLPSTNVVAAPTGAGVVVPPKELDEFATAHAKGMLRQGETLLAVGYLYQLAPFFARFVPFSRLVYDHHYFAALTSERILLFESKPSLFSSALATSIKATFAIERAEIASAEPFDPRAFGTLAVRLALHDGARHDLAWLSEYKHMGGQAAFVAAFSRWLTSPAPAASEPRAMDVRVRPLREPPPFAEGAGALLGLVWLLAGIGWLAQMSAFGCLLGPVALAAGGFVLSRTVPRLARRFGVSQVPDLSGASARAIGAVGATSLRGGWVAALALGVVLVITGVGSLGYAWVDRYETYSRYTRPGGYVDEYAERVARECVRPDAYECRHAREMADGAPAYTNGILVDVALFTILGLGALVGAAAAGAGAVVLRRRAAAP